MTRQYYLIENPTPEQWREALQWALARAQRVAFLHHDLRGPLPKPLQPFKEQATDAYTTCHYWEARQLRPVRVIELRLNDALREFLLRPATLSAWETPPPGISDFLLYDARDEPLLWTISHEDYLFLRLDDQEVAKWRGEGWRLLSVPDNEKPVLQRDTPCLGRTWGDRFIMIVGIVMLLAFCGMAFYMIEGFLRLFGG